MKECLSEFRQGLLTIDNFPPKFKEAFSEFDKADQCVKVAYSLNEHEYFSQISDILFTHGNTRSIRAFLAFSCLESFPETEMIKTVETFIKLYQDVLNITEESISYHKQYLDKAEKTTDAVLDDRVKLREAIILKLSKLYDLDKKQKWDEGENKKKKEDEKKKEDARKERESQAKKRQRLRYPIFKMETLIQLGQILIQH